MEKRTRKALSEKLNHPVQVLLKEHEYKIFDRIRRELNFPTIAAYGRMIFLREIDKKKQVEMF